MARTKEILFAQSLMERLNEDLEMPTTQVASLRLVKEAIRRDLEALLNTRKPLGRELENYELASSSVLNYGLDDLSSLKVTPNGHLVGVQRALEQCLADYEPRLTEVSVSVEEGDFLKREIRLHIEANLPLYPTVEAVSFDTVFNVTNETYAVAG